MRALIKRMKNAEKATPIVEVYEKVGKSVPTAVGTKKVINVKEAVAPKKGTTEKVFEVRSEEEVVEANVLDTTKKVASPHPPPLRSEKMNLLITYAK